jgi:hypothetical protein
MDLDMLKLCWQEEGRAEARPTLNSGTVSEWIEAKAADVRRDVRRRLRREVGYYVPTVLVLAVLGDIGSRAGLLFVLVLAGMFGTLIATLWYAERRLAAAPRDLSLRDALYQLLAAIERTSHTYLVAFVAVFASASVLIAGLFWWRNGIDRRLAFALVAGALAIAWAYWSGRDYVRRIFGPYRAALTECLRELGADDE